MPADRIQIQLDLWIRIRIPGGKTDPEFSKKNREVTTNLNIKTPKI
jgi:hypothetical protein